MKYLLEPKINDGKTEAPGVEVETEDFWNDGDFPDIVADEMTNDYGQPFGVGFTLTITRIA